MNKENGIKIETNLQLSHEANDTAYYQTGNRIDKTDDKNDQNGLWPRFTSQSSHPACLLFFIFHYCKRKYLVDVRFFRDIKNLRRKN